ncbi:PAP2 superfamily protein [Flavobacteriaceae bacterium MAR_2010_105]|nr:PAP2 superfamily protein [Flavobacteriaceae bacterium MAR_2010_105]
MKTKWVATQNAGKFRAVSRYLIHRSSLLLTSMVLLLILSCAKSDDLEPVDNELLVASQKASKQELAHMVLVWNKAMQDLYTFPKGVGTPPISTAYTWSLVHLAMHDALNSITPRYETYATVSRDKDADPDAAVAQAAYDVIMAVNQLPFAFAFVPQNLTSINTLLETTLDAIPDGDAKTRGIAQGHAVAQAVMAKRASDLPHLGLFSPNQPADGTQPGEYRHLQFNGTATSPKGFAFPNFHNLQPFFMTENDMLRPDPPYPVDSPEYALDFNEVKAIGADNSLVRTADQTEIGIFWAENSNRAWNDVARKVLESYNPQSQNAWKTARYFALIHGAIVDSYISTTESKRYYYSWRPISAIQLADTDGNDNTVADPNWAPLFLTAPVPEYPSVHAFTGGATAQIIYRIFDNKDNYNFERTSGYLPGVVRTFSSISDAVRENSLSHLYIGYHFRQAIDVGEDLGKALGDYVYENALKEKY